MAKLNNSVTPSVSIIIATYNYGNFITKAVESVLKQTFSDREIIVIDDGSKDHTAEVLKPYLDRIRYFKQEHLGVSAARNLGIHKAVGKYFLFLDADDYLLPHALETRVEFLENNPSVRWVYGPWYIQNHMGEDISYLGNNLPLAFNSRQQGDILGFLLMGGLLVTPAVMVQATITAEIGGFRERLKVYEDYQFWLECAAKSPIGYIDDKNVVVVRHEQSFGQLHEDGYATILKILLEAEKRWPEIIQKLGFRWKRRIGFVLGERGRSMVKNGLSKQGRKLLLHAMARDPFHVSHLIGLFKSFF